MRCTIAGPFARRTRRVSSLFSSSLSLLSARGLSWQLDRRGILSSSSSKSTSSSSLSPPTLSLSLSLSLSLISRRHRLTDGARGAEEDADAAKLFSENRHFLPLSPSRIRSNAMGGRGLLESVPCTHPLHSTYTLYKGILYPVQ